MQKSSYKSYLDNASMNRFLILEVCVVLLIFTFLGCISPPPAEIGKNTTNLTNITPEIGKNVTSQIEQPFNVSLEELNHNIDKYVNKTVLVNGFFGHKFWHGRTGMSYLIRDEEMLTLTKPLPEYSYVRLNSEINESFEGKKMQVTGKVSIGIINYPLEVQNKVAVILVENYSVIE